MVEIIPPWGIQSPLTTDSPDDWLARDHNVDRPVYLLVSGPPALHYSQSARWSVAWPVGGVFKNEMVAWRFVQLETLSDPLDTELEPHYAYFGAITKTIAPGTLSERFYELGTCSLAKRKSIEELAQTIPVPAATCDIESHTLWTRDLLEKLVASGALSKVTCDDVLRRACSV